MAYQHIDCKKYLLGLRQAAQLFELAGAVDLANDLRRGLEKLGDLTETTLTPDIDWNVPPQEDVLDGALFDIPMFWDGAVLSSPTHTLRAKGLTLEIQAWESGFPTLDMFVFN